MEVAWWIHLLRHRLPGWLPFDSPTRPQLAADCRPCIVHVRAAPSQLRHSLYDVALSVSIINPSRFSFIARFKRPRNFLLSPDVCRNSFFFYFCAFHSSTSFSHLLKFAFYSSWCFEIFFSFLREDTPSCFFFLTFANRIRGI